VKLRILGAAVMPKAVTVGNFGETKNLLDSTVAVGRNDDKVTGKFCRRCDDPHDNVVVKFTLLPVVDVLPSEWFEAIEHALEAQSIG
jgi:hypothetical protein